MAAHATQANYQMFEEHNLKNHWGIAKKLLTTYLKQLNQSRACLKPIEAMVDEIHELDPDGFQFRYPRSKSKLDKETKERIAGEITLAGVTYIQLGEVKRRMDEISEIMDGLSHMLAESCD